MYSTFSTRLSASLDKSRHIIRWRSKDRGLESAHSIFRAACSRHQQLGYCGFHSSSSNCSHGEEGKGSTHSDGVTLKSNRSPYAILNLKTSATTVEIKHSFRKLAKKYHPDLNPQLSPAVSQAKMSELIRAYDQLMDDDFLGRVGDGRVALACEMFTLQELKMDRFHDVHPIRIRFKNGIGNDCTATTASLEGESEEEKSLTEDSAATSSDVSTFHYIEHVAHPDDSISDVKRQLQSLYLHDWGLDGRRLDRDDLATGWEIICSDKQSGENENSLEVMSYHLFLHNYDIIDGDMIYAVIRKYD